MGCINEYQTNLGKMVFEKFYKALDDNHHLFLAMLENYKTPTLFAGLILV